MLSSLWVSSKEKPATINFSFLLSCQKVFQRSISKLSVACACSGGLDRLGYSPWPSAPPPTQALGSPAAAWVAALITVVRSSVLESSLVGSMVTRLQHSPEQTCSLTSPVTSVPSCLQRKERGTWLEALLLACPWQEVDNGAIEPRTEPQSTGWLMITRLCPIKLPDLALTLKTRD